MKKARKHTVTWNRISSHSDTVLKELGNVEHWRSLLESDLDALEEALHLAGLWEDHGARP